VRRRPSDSSRRSSLESDAALLRRGVVGSGLKDSKPLVRDDPDQPSPTAAGSGSCCVCQIDYHYPPIPYVAFYEVMPDKNGEIWAAALHSGRFLRFDPRTDRWIDYMLPEPELT